jgi:hypothetical protein
VEGRLWQEICRWWGSIAEGTCVLRLGVILLVDLNCKWVSSNQRILSSAEMMAANRLLFKRLLMGGFPIICFIRKLFLTSQIYFFNSLPFYAMFL